MTTRTDRRRNGTIFIVSAPSGAGKTTLCEAARRHFADIAYSVSHTTRPPRAGELDGIAYHFITPAEFEKGIEQGQWAEWARVHGNYYGTSADWIRQTLQQGKDVLMDIDVQGTRQMLARFPSAVTIFIMPPSLEVLKQRIQQRGTDGEDAVALRLANAEAEIAQKDFYRHILVNDDLHDSIRGLIAIIESHRRLPSPSEAV